jgi:hypothetical protein
MTLRFPLGAHITASWICPTAIEGLVEARVLFRRQAEREEFIALDEFVLTAGPDDFADGVYKIGGTSPRTLKPGTYRPQSARVRLRDHTDPVSVDLERYGDEFAIVLFDDSVLAPEFSLRTLDRV